MLNDFVQKDGPLYVSGVEDVVPNMKAEIEKARTEGVTVIYTCDHHKPDNPEMSVWGPHAMAGTKGAEIIDELAPAENDIVIHKETYDSFYQTELEDTLKNLGITDLTVIGVCTEICVHYTSSSAIIRGYNVKVKEDCVKGLNETNANSALNMVNHVLQNK
jgi:nicotinamidase-related amidase